MGKVVFSGNVGAIAERKKRFPAGISALVGRKVADAYIPILPEVENIAESMGMLAVGN
jgi:hypothetical protein